MRPTIWLTFCSNCQCERFFKGLACTTCRVYHPISFKGDTDRPKAQHPTSWLRTTVKVPRA